MNDAIGPVRYGMLVGLTGLILGISWAFWLVLGHERIHETLERGMAAQETTGHMDMGEMRHEHGMASMPSPDEYRKEIMDESHRRLVRGHLHAMGLGLVTIAVSFVLASTSGSLRVKTLASIACGLGGIIYPLAWIVMGYLTPSLGLERAEASVTPIAGPGVALVVFGIGAAIVCLARDVFRKRA